MNGKGKFNFPDGNTYEGDYQDEKKHGKGTLIDPDGDKYEAEW